MTQNQSEVVFLKKYIRVHRADAAFVYFIMESYEGSVSYSTLPSKQTELYRDLELSIPSEFDVEVQNLIQQLGEWVYEIK